MSAFPQCDLFLVLRQVRCMRSFFAKPFNIKWFDLAQYQLWTDSNGTRCAISIDSMGGEPERFPGSWTNGVRAESFYGLAGTKALRDCRCTEGLSHCTT